MRTGLRWILLAAIVMASFGERVGAQAPASAATAGLRIEWTADPGRGPWQPVCGYVYNDTAAPSREVRLLVEGRDDSEQIIDSRVVPVLGYIAPWGRTYFCSSATAGAARYSVTIVEAR